MDITAELEDLKDRYNLWDSVYVLEAVEYVLDDGRFTPEQKIDLARSVVQTYWELQAEG